MLTSTHVDYDSSTDDILTHAYLYPDHQECELDFKGPTGPFPEVLQWSGNFVPKTGGMIRMYAKDPVAMILFGTDAMSASYAFSQLYNSNGKDSTPYISRPEHKYGVVHDSHPLTLSGFWGKMRILSLSMHGSLYVRPVIVKKS